MENPVHEAIRKEVTTNDVVLYMKGSPVFPQCGFSAAVVQVLTHLGVRFKGVDVLTDPGLRQGVKEFSNWPTIPQLYVKGEFVGGCDIIREMYQTGELSEMLNTSGIELQPQA
ncbi:MAG: Grx4 family monothiol glutaredoxin [Inquilinus sp.]|nr:Grx4 family monothiol glutaredoxin [Inquilinus sp.]